MSKQSIALAAIAALALSLSACGSENKPADPTPVATQQTSQAPADDKSEAPKPEETVAETPEASEEAPATPAPTAEESTAAKPGEVQAGGSYTASIDGKPFEIEGAKVLCSGAPADASIMVGAENAGSNPKAIVLTMKDGQVASLVMGDATAGSVTYAAGAGQGSAEVTVDGKTYTVKGSGPYVDAANPTKFDNKPFELSVTCA